MQNPKLIALAQTLFYGFVTVATPLLINAFQVNGALYGWLPLSVTGIVLFGLNQLENYIQAQTGKAMFGTLR